MSPVLVRSREEGRDELTSDEAILFVEEQVQAALGMSTAEFRRRAEAGDLPDNPNVVHLALLCGVHLHTC